MLGLFWCLLLYWKASEVLGYFQTLTRYPRHLSKLNPSPLQVSAVFVLLLQTLLPQELCTLAYVFRVLSYFCMCAILGRGHNLSSESKVCVSLL